MFEKHNPPIGARPGTLAIPAGSPAPRIYVMDYSREALQEREVNDVSELEAFVDTQTTTWVDIRGLGDETRLRAIAKLFGIHPLALEDAVNIPQRAKSVLWERHQLIVARLPQRTDGGEVEVPQVCFILGKHYLVTFQERYFGFFDSVRRRIRDGLGPMRDRGPDYLASALIDTLVDFYFPLVEGQSNRLNELEDEVMESPSPTTLGEVHRLRREIAIVRRIGWPQRELLNSLVRDPSPFISNDVRAFLRATFDHISQIMELVDSSREIAVGIVDIYMSTMSHRQNEVMKVLTLMASIFIPLTFVAGIYGMNFDHMPELHSYIAYPLVLVVMAVIAAGMIVYFWRRGWLGGE